MDFIRDYGQDKESAKQFLRDFTYVDENGEQIHKYSQMLTKLANRELKLMVIDLSDLEKFNHDLAKHIANNTLRYTQIFYEALDELLPLYKTAELAEKDVMDVFIEQRLYIAERNKNANQNHLQTNNGGSQSMLGQTTDIDGKYPADLIRRAEICFKPASLQSTPIRKVLAEHIGKLVTVRGIVTRVADVKPKIKIVCYTCDQCGCESFQPVGGYEFTPLFECTSAICKANKTLGRLTMQIRGSKFIKYQEIKIQEHSDQVPIGHIPRMATIMAHGEQTRQCAPGDHVSISGVFLTIEKSNFRMRSGGLSADTYVEAHYITQMNKTEDDEVDNEPMSIEDAQNLVRNNTGFLNYLSGSIAPEIFGHENLKKALMLLLVGGVDRNPDGMKVRGNINICLMGDPGVAKSQMLGFIDRLASRSQYTTGRGSSGVGLTAAILKDPVTNELSLEGGALVLADQGICCIDEFDKMMEADRTAIHEVMEQQTVSIAKAGIMTTLNARVSILAAANPAYGRYDVNRQIQENLQLPPALLSRFDLIWLIRDTPEKCSDLELAEHITNIHTNPLEEQTFDNVLSMKDMRRFINLCKRKEPIVPESLADRFVSIYLSIRARKRLAKDSKKDADSLFTSPRSLLAIIRMATALARLRLADEVEGADIDEAVRLYNCSRESIEGGIQGDSLLDEVMNLLTSICKDGRCSMSDFLNDARKLAEPLPLKNALEDLQKIDSISIEDDLITLL